MEKLRTVTRAELPAPGDSSSLKLTASLEIRWRPRSELCWPQIHIGPLLALLQGAWRSWLQGTMAHMVIVMEARVWRLEVWKREQEVWNLKGSLVAKMSRAQIGLDRASKLPSVVPTLILILGTILVLVLVQVVLLIVVEVVLLIVVEVLLLQSVLLVAMPKRRPLALASRAEAVLARPGAWFVLSADSDVMES